MSGLHVYTTDYDPQAVYAAEAGSDRDRTPVERAVRFGDGPLDLYVDLRDEDEQRVLWTFRGKRGATTNRTGYFVADYVTDDDPFRGLAAALAALHDEGWTVPYAGDLRWDAGFELWRIPPAVESLSRAERDRLFERLTEGVEEPVSLAVPDHEEALALVRALAAAEVPCRVAVGTGGDRSNLPDVDLLLVPDGTEVPEARSPAGSRILGSTEVTESTTDDSPTAGTTGSEAEGGEPLDRTGRLGPGGRLATAVLLVVLGFAGYSFVSLTPVHPISGLAAVGGLVGSAAAYVAVGPALWPSDGAGGTARAVALTPGRERPDTAAVVLAYGTAAGFLFPTLFRVTGSALTGDRWLLGTVAEPGGATASVSLFVGVLLVANACGLLLAGRSGRGPRTDGTTVARLLAAHVCYGTALLLATALASPLWYQAVPSVT